MVTPYKSDESKKEQVATMFNNIAPKYDFLNHFFSMGTDILWRKKAIRLLKEDKPSVILDLATGTGDFAFEAMSLNPSQVIGMDISEGMLDVGRQKVKKRGLEGKIDLKYGDSANLPLADESVDALTIGFGVRNFENLEKGLSEMLRVLRPGGKAVILEFSKPSSFPIKQLYNFYFKNIMPLLGRLVSKDSSAYTYLPESVQAFPEGTVFLDILRSVGYREVKAHRLSGGIATIYVGRK
ncbi:MAG: bifunctional demethylmenaquinone methyltransferase/2-methoxy-6-polyprenyl-1,4-benzoquinol methylase UbiE [Bacteroidota bacterium]